MRNAGYRSSDLNPLYAIIVINLLVYIANIVATLLGYQKLVLYLGLQPINFLAMPWTMVTNLFTHVSLWHLLANMLTLYFFGRFLIQLIGARNSLIIYFLGGILGNIFYVLTAFFTPLASPYSVVIGASGAIFALGGVLTVLTPKLRVIIFPIPIPMPLWVAIVVGFLVLSLLPNVAWEGHLGGLVLGVIAGFILRKKHHRPFY